MLLTKLAVRTLFVIMTSNADIIVVVGRTKTNLDAYQWGCMKIYKFHNASHSIIKMKIMSSRIKVEESTKAKIHIYIIENCFNLVIYLIYILLHDLYVLIAEIHKV